MLPKNPAFKAGFFAYKAGCFLYNNKRDFVPGKFREDTRKMGPFSKQDHLVITTLGLEFAVAEILGAGAGLYLDKKWGTTPWLFLFGVAVGFTLGMYIIIRGAKEAERKDQLGKK